MKDKVKLLELCGFKRNSYKEGIYWELTIKEDANKKQMICDAFGMDKELELTSDAIETLILQCEATHMQDCVLYYDLNLSQVDLDEFFKCLVKLSQSEKDVM